MFCAPFPGEPGNGSIRELHRDLVTGVTQIAEFLSQKYQVKVSKTVIKKLLKIHNYRRRKAQKNKTMKMVANRDEQFKNIKKLTDEFSAKGSPIISFDTKKTIN